MSEIQSNGEKSTPQKSRRPVWNIVILILLCLIAGGGAVVSGRILQDRLSPPARTPTQTAMPPTIVAATARPASTGTPTNRPISTPLETLTPTPLPTEMSFTPREKISTANASRLRLWRSMTLGTLTLQVGFSPDGKWLAAAREGGVDLWDWRNGEIVSTFPEMAGNVAFSPDSKQIIVGDGVHDIATGALVNDLKTEIGSCGYWVFSPNGRYAACACAGGSTFIWDARTWEIIHELETGSADSIVFSQDGNRIVVGLISVSFQVWDVPSGKKLYERPEAVLPLFFTPDGNAIWLLVNYQLDIPEYEVKTWHLGAQQMETPPGFENEMTFWHPGPIAKDGNMYLLYDFGGEPKHSDIRPSIVCFSDSCPNPKRQDFLEPNFRSAAFSPDLLFLAGSRWLPGVGERLELWAVAPPVPAATPSPGATPQLISPNTVDDVVELRKITDSDGATDLAFSPDGRKLLTDGQTGVHLYGLPDFSGLNFLPTKLLVRTVAVAPRGDRAAYSFDDGSIRIWNYSTGRDGPYTVKHKEPVYGLAFSPDGKLLASASRDGTVHLWDSETMLPLHEMKGHGETAWAVAFSPDGKLLASASSDRTVRIWDVESGRALTVLEGHSAAVYTVAFSPDGTMLASGSDDGSIVLWNPATWTALGKVA